MTDYYFLLLALTVLSSLFFVFVKTRRAIHMLQQNQYYFKRFYQWMVTHPRDLLLRREMLLIFVMLIGIILVSSINQQMIVFAVGQLVLFLTYTRGESKKPLVYTPRVKRLFFTVFVLFYALSYFALTNDALNQDSLIVYLAILTLMETLLFVFVFVAHVINWPFEKGVYYRYFYDAYFKIRRHKRLTKIGITGSFGKTSSKNIIHTILNYRYNSLASPASYNTPMGLTRTIREHLKPIHEVFVAEMGAYKRGDIKVLANFVKPKYGVITSIGPAHLDTFGSIENVLKGKFELVESLGKDGTAVLNRDDELQRHYVIQNKCHVKWYGINEEADVMATDIVLSSKGTSFTLKVKKNPVDYRIETKLLGRHNVYNILAAITIGIEMGMDIKDLVNAIRYVEPVEHRLSLKKAGHITYIDDAFNSNPVGSKMALEVLDQMPGKKIIVTPGMIELGDQQTELNQAFGRQIADVCDVVILVGEKQTLPIQNGLMERAFDMDKCHIVNDVKKAFEIIHGMGQDEMYVLLENDLPDLFNE